MSIYIAKAGQQHGPYEVAALADLFRSGQITLNDLAWSEGEAGWLPLQEYAAKKGLILAAAPTPVAQVTVVAPKSMAFAYVLLLLFGFIGAHRFYLGRVMSGLAIVLLLPGGFVAAVLSVILLTINGVHLEGFNAGSSYTTILWSWFNAGGSYATAILVAYLMMLAGSIWLLLDLVLIPAWFDQLASSRL